MPGVARRARSQRPVDPLDPAAAREAALRLLERTRRTRSELARRLKEKGFAPEAIDRTLDRLAEVGLVNDVEYARAYLAGRVRRRSAGFRRLEQELRGRGVSAEDIAQGRQLLEVEGGAGDETDSARRVIAQTAKRYSQLDAKTKRQRLTALLVRRGFAFDTIQAALTAPKEDDGDDA